MERLNGIGVSPGVAVGPALVAIQRTQVLRFPVGPDGVARELSALDPEAIARVRDEARPAPRNADELHDLLLSVLVLRPPATG